MCQSNDETVRLLVFPKEENRIKIQMNKLDSPRHCIIKEVRCSSGSLSLRGGGVGDVQDSVWQ